MTNVTVTYHNDSETQRNTYTSGSTISIADQIFVKDYMSIKGWATSSGSTQITYSVGQVITISSNMDLYAVWGLINEGAFIFTQNNVTYDVSPLVLDANVICGKNQPFPVLQLSLLKNLLVSYDYWHDQRGLQAVPTFTSSETTLTINIFGITGTWNLEKIEDNDNSVINYVFVHPAYILKKVSLNDVLTPTYNTSTNKLTLTSVLNGATWEYDCTLQTTGVGKYRTNNGLWYFDITDGTITLEFLEDTLTNIVSTVLSYVLPAYATSGSQVVSTGYVYTDNNGVPIVKSTEYDASAFAGYKTSDSVPTELQKISVRPNTNCWELITSVGALTNRSPFFYDKFYFLDYIKRYDNKPLIDAPNAPNEFGTAQDPIEIDYGDSDIDLLSISANADQGSKYILASQTVTAENYSITSKVKNGGTNVGAEIKFPARDADVVFQGANQYTNDYRNTQCQTIALNELVKWYKPGDCIQYTVSETLHPQVVDVLPVSGAVTGEIVSISDPNAFFDAYYRYNGSQWVQISDIVLNNTRTGALSLNSVGTITDKQNNISLIRAPLALAQVSYPAGTVTYTWGEPYFMDEEQQITAIKSVTDDSTLKNTADVKMSDNYSAKIVVGNKSMSELDTNRTGFTGLILEKNWDTDLYRLCGYYNGDEQAEFNTQGKISAGRGAIILDENGMTARDTNNNVVATIDRTGSYNTGFLNGSAHVRLNNGGLTHIIPNQRSTYLDQAGINFIAEADPTYKIFQINSKYGQYLGAESSDNVYAVDLYATPDRQGGIKSVLRLLKKPWASGVQVTTGLFDSSYITAQAYYTACTTSYVSGSATSSVGTQYINTTGDYATRYTSMKTLFEAKNTSMFGVETYGPYGTDPNDPCVSAIDIIMESTLNAPCYVLNNATSAVWTVNINSNESRITGVKIGYKTSYGGAFIYTSPSSLNPNQSATLQVTLPGECYGLIIHIEGYHPGSFTIVPQPSISSNINFTTDASGSEVRLFDDHLSLCGKTTILGNLTGDFTVDSTFKNSMTNSGFAIIKGDPFYSEAYTGNSGYIDIPIENKDGKMRINWKTVYMANADTSATINWVAPFKDSNYAVWVSLNIKTGQNYNNAQCGPLWTRCDGSYQNASMTTVCNDAWNGYICALAIGRAPNYA